MVKNKTELKEDTSSETIISDVKIGIINNEIYFSSDICDASVLKLIEELRKMELKNMKFALENGVKAPSIKLFIHSYGGSALAGVAAMDAIEALRVPVTTIINGACASAGTLLSVVGDHRFISKNSYMLIHQLSNVHWGNFEQLKDNMKNSKELMRMIRNVYLNHTTIPKKKLKKILKKDLWFNAEKCIELGLVDGIYGE